MKRERYTGFMMGWMDDSLCQLQKLIGLFLFKKLVVFLAHFVPTLCVMVLSFFNPSGECDAIKQNESELENIG